MPVVLNLNGLHILLCTIISTIAHVDTCLQQPLHNSLWQCHVLSSVVILVLHAASQLLPHVCSTSSLPRFNCTCHLCFKACKPSSGVLVVLHSTRGIGMQTLCCKVADHTQLARRCCCAAAQARLPDALSESIADAL
jgi:hypothetical protein